MAVNVQAQIRGGAGFGLSQPNGSDVANAAATFAPDQPAFWSAVLFMAFVVIVVLVALSAWEKL